jgi:Spy/CpxP family protein refolding chaperone
MGLAVAGTALAQQPGGAPGAPPQRERLLTPEDRAAMAQIFWHRAQERVGLTDQQVADIRTLLQTQRAATRADVQGLITARQQLRSLLEQPTVDPASLQAAATQIKSLQAKLLDDRLQTQLALRAKLTPEQWQAWRALRKGRGPHWMRRGRAFGPGA